MMKVITNEWMSQYSPPEIELDSLLKIPFLRIVHNTYLKQKEKEMRASKEQEKAQTEEDGTSDKEGKVDWDKRKCQQLWNFSKKNGALQ